MNEYTEQAEQFLKKHNISFSAIRKADKCPLWCKDDHIHGERYLVTFKRKDTNQKYSLSFWNSLNDTQTGEKLSAYDVLAGIQKYNPGDFEEFCNSFGYSKDSIEASKIYRAVIKEWLKVSKFFSPSELTEAQEIN